MLAIFFREWTLWDSLVPDPIEEGLSLFNKIPENFPASVGSGMNPVFYM